jgi:hypothetical protein
MPSATAIQWTDAIERAMLEALIEQARMGFASDNGFKKPAWNAAVEAIQRQIFQVREDGSSPTVTQAQANAKNSELKMLYTEYKHLRDQGSGFGYDEETGLFTAPDDVWNSFLKAC